MADNKNEIFPHNGKLPPQAIQMEEAVLGALLLDKSAYLKVADIIKPEMFYKDEHKKIYEAVQQLQINGNPVDTITMTDRLRKNGTLELIGGAYSLIQLTDKCGSTANVEYNARVISEKFIQRELIRISFEIQSEAYDDTTDVFDLQESAQRKIMGIASGLSTSSLKTSKELYKDAIARNDILINSKNKLTGIPSGLTEIDRITGGWQNSDLIILAARPSMGKTALSLEFLKFPAIRRGLPTAIFSLEMSNRQLYSRLLAQETGVDLEIILRKGMNEYTLQQALSKADIMCNANMFFDDQPALSVFELRTRARRIVLEHGVKLIIVDYLQLMRGDNMNKNSNREQEISYISRSLKALAKELDIPIIALAQLSRASEKRGGQHVPMLSDLRDSGSIEQDADMVMFIHRPEYYGLTETEDGSSTQGLAEIIFSKHRNGNIGKVEIEFVGRTTSFLDRVKF